MSRTVLAPNERIQDIEQEITIRASLVQVFEALTTGRIIDEWGGGPARVQAKTNGKISLWDGQMHGSIKEIEYPTRLVHTFREEIWDPSYMDSLVVWTLTEAARGTLIRLVHSGLPTRKIREQHNDGWGEYFLGPMKVYLEG